MWDKDKAVRLKKEGKTLQEIQEILNIEYIPYKTFQRAVLRHENKLEEVKLDTKEVKSYTEEIINLLSKEQTIENLSKKLEISERIVKAYIEDIKEEGYNIIEVGSGIKISKSVLIDENKYTKEWSGDRIIRFGSVSDTHMCSKWQQLTHLNHLYDVFEREGITTVYHSGDITEGFKMRPGHELEIFKHGADEQEQYVIDNYPVRKGIVTEFITGNHDHSHIKNGGHDIGRVIAKARQDMIYLGPANAKIKLTPNCILELNHPLDGASYALSYTIQKTIDAMSGGEKPNILLNGHHHKLMYLFYRNIHAFECGTFESQTPWMRGKRIAAHMGGWIITVHVDEEGTITRCIGECIPFYKADEGDY